MERVRYGSLGLVYQRGFIGLHDGHIPIDKSGVSIDLNIAQNTASVNSNKEQMYSRYAYHRDVIRLTDIFRKDNNAITNTEFIRSVLTIAKDLFYDMNNFIHVQSSSPLITGTHYDFIDDVFNFIQYGRTDLDFNNWILYLNIAMQDNASGIIPQVTTERAEASKERFKLLSADHQVTHRNPFLDYEDLLQRWLSRDSGIVHLLKTLYVILGDNHE